MMGWSLSGDMGYKMPKEKTLKSFPKPVIKIGNVTIYEKLRRNPGYQDDEEDEEEEEEEVVGPESQF